MASIEAKTSAISAVSDLAKSLDGRIEYGFGAQFPSFLLVFPLTERERRANRAVASRRAKEAESAVEAPYRHEMENA